MGGVRCNKTHCTTRWINSTLYATSTVCGRQIGYSTNKYARSRRPCELWHDWLDECDWSLRSNAWCTLRGICNISYSGSSNWPIAHTELVTAFGGFACEAGRDDVSDVRTTPGTACERGRGSKRAWGHGWALSLDGSGSRAFSFITWCSSFYVWTGWRVADVKRLARGYGDSRPLWDDWAKRVAYNALSFSWAFTGTWAVIAVALLCWGIDDEGDQ